MKYISWNEFDKSVDFIANKSKLWKISGVYGVPRGGLCLAVALSHKLNLKMFEKPIKNSLIVDDVYETGFTLNKFKDIEGAYFFVLFSKETPIWWNTVHKSSKTEWLVFPWENPNTQILDKKQYKRKRGLI